MRGDGPMRSAIGSLRRCGAGVGIGTGCAGAAVTEWVGVVSTLRGATCWCAGLAKNGAGCDPDCKNTALTTITVVIAAAARMAKESIGRSATVVHAPATSEAAVPDPRPRLRRSLRRSRTFLHRSVGAQRRNVAQVHGICRLHCPGADNRVRGDVDRADRSWGAPLRGA